MQVICEFLKNLQILQKNSLFYENVYTITHKCLLHFPKANRREEWHMMKKLFAALLSLIMLLSLGACGSSKKAETPAQEAPAAEAAEPAKPAEPEKAAQPEKVTEPEKTPEPAKTSTSNPVM